MNPLFEAEQMINRRQFFGRTTAGIGAAALGSMLGPDIAQAAGMKGELPDLHFAPKAKRVIYLFQSGGPSQLDLFSHKPKMRALQGTELPDSVRQGQRITGMTSGQKTLPIASTLFDFKQHGQSGTWMSELMPHTAKVVDDICLINTLNTEAINHDPGITYLQTGHQQPGRPSMGSWMSYGLGSENDDLPGFIVLISHGSSKRDAQALFQRLWGAGFLPSEHQGVNFRAAADPVLYLTNPPGIDKETRRRMLDGLAELNDIQYQEFSDPEIVARISQYEMAYRMQASVPDLTDISDEPESTFELYGEDSRKPGTFAANCLLARRMAEKDVRFIQLYHRGWDQHGSLPRDLRLQSKDVDQASAALITDLKQRGMLDDTLVVWAGEFGRTIYCQGALKQDDYGRDHHGRCYSMWMAGGGVKGGMTYGESDDFGYNIVKDPVHVHDLNATIMNQMGVNHEKLTYRFQGRDFRLTDIHGEVVKGILA